MYELHDIPAPNFPISHPSMSIAMPQMVAMTLMMMTMVTHTGDNDGDAVVTTIVVKIMCMIIVR